MGNAFFVVWRESLEAFLIAGILYAWLKANADSGAARATAASRAGRKRKGTDIIELLVFGVMRAGACPGLRCP